MPGEDGVITYDVLREEHLDAAARLRGGWTRHGLYSLLGPGFWRVFLSGLVAAPDAVAFCGVGPDGDFAGFTFGTTDVERMHDQILDGRRFALARASLVGIARHPAILPRVLRGALRPMSKDPDMGVAQWASIIIEEKYRRRSVAEVLGRLFSAAMLDRGLESYYGTVELDNDASNAFMQSRAAGKILKVIQLDDVPHNLFLFPARPLDPLPEGHRLGDGPGVPRMPSPA